MNGISEAAHVNSSMVKMFVFLGIVAMMLSATGLFTLVPINILRKMKEIGVRKVFGASLGNIAKVINAEFVLILVIASVIGTFAGVYLSTSLMRSIWNYYQAANVIVIGTSVFILFAISTLTIGFKVYNTTKMNPINTLKDE
jgi:ABC-type antimicrobial peptide transport system permease subunit